MLLVETRTLVQSYPAVPNSVPLARQNLVEFALGAGADEHQAEDIKLSVSEALTNVVLHAYPGQAGAIEVRADVAGGELWVLVCDDGGGLRSQNASPGLGVGLALIAQTSDGLTIVNRAAGGTEVRMRFVVDPDAVRQPYERGSSFSANSPAWPPFSTTM